MTHAHRAGDTQVTYQSHYPDEFEIQDDRETHRHARRGRQTVQTAWREDELHAPARTRKQRPPRKERDQAFKCRHCKQFIGAPISGGRHRNHCPNCLYSRHVDRSVPGDRRSDCGSLMAPVGVLNRRNGEQMILHRCLGCGKEGPNRIAADDDPTILMRLLPVQSVHGRRQRQPLAPEFPALTIDLVGAFEPDEENRSA